MILVRVMFVAFNQELTYSINNEEYRFRYCRSTQNVNSSIFVPLISCLGSKLEGGVWTLLKINIANGVEKQQPFQAILLNTSFAIKNVMNCLLARFYIWTITAWISYRVLTCLLIL